MKKFEIPSYFHSTIISEVKMRRRISDPRKQDFTPSTLDFGNFQLILPRHFGFCYGVENAIETSYKAIKENPGKRLFLLSEMIHNPAVNQDLQDNGIQFLMDTNGNQLTPWDDLKSDDVIIIPAFGTTVEIENKIKELGIATNTYNTTCPFVEKVWKRSSEIGLKGYSIIIHGKHKHEETRATFSHSYQDAPSIIIRDMEEAILLSSFMDNQKSEEEFHAHFSKKISPNFNFRTDLQKVGVVNQTTMLATETQAIADFFKDIMQKKHGENFKSFFADTRDTLCYATNDNQQSTLQTLTSESDLALVIGGYNSSNTSQIAAILATKMPTYYIESAEEILSENEIQHFDYPNQKLQISQDWLPNKKGLRMVITSGASCPDTIFEAVLRKVLEFIPPERTVEEVLSNFLKQQ